MNIKASGTELKMHHYFNCKNRMTKVMDAPITEFGEKKRKGKKTLRRPKDSDNNCQKPHCWVKMVGPPGEAVETRRARRLPLEGGPGCPGVFARAQEPSLCSSARLNSLFIINEILKTIFMVYSFLK